MNYERLWERLLELLRGLGTVNQTAEGRIEVEVMNRDGSARTVEILMTPIEWDNMVTIPWGEFDAAGRQVIRSLRAMREDERFLVYGDYELVASQTPTLPTDPDEI